MIRINLLKPERKEIRETAAAPEAKIKKREKPQLFGLIIIVAIAAVAALYFHQKSEISKEQELLDAALKEKKELQYVNVKLQELDQQKALLARKIDLIRGLKSQQRNAVNIMDELSRHLPDWVWLTETDFSENRVRIKGKCMSNNLLADYIRNLKSSPFFPNVQMNSSTLRRAGTSQYLEFSLTAAFTSGEAPRSEESGATKEGRK